ncbi:phosphoesterase [Bacillus sp. MUM 116]|uniref:IDEAL domain-containing protein n=1 Tax=Bacillus xiapuensis TaxID=2014075 RepID=A0ABU6N9W7_9BACI|nr:MULTISPECIES: IDEAL domain-containing protein [Bacillus]MED3562053.1 IDEAL domain-containing protein [Bacillus xiapuensis]OIK09085.1 phosphoesterase [Bacillus sp. MUM 116]
MEKKLLNSPQQPNEEMDSKIAEMVLNNALLEFRKAKLREEIDRSLLERNKEDFLKLSEELKKIS